MLRRAVVAFQHGCEQTGDGKRYAGVESSLSVFVWWR